MSSSVDLEVCFVACGRIFRQLQVLFVLGSEVKRRKPTASGVQICKAARKVERAPTLYRRKLMILLV